MDWPTTRRRLLKSTSNILLIVGYVFMVLAAVSTIAGVVLEWPLNETLTAGAVTVASMLLVVTARALAKQKPWAWYLAVLFSIAGITSFFLVPWPGGESILFISVLLFVGLVFFWKDFLGFREAKA